MRFRYRIYSVLAFLWLCTWSASAQSGLNSPYTRYGLGELSEQMTHVNGAMGGTGIGMRERNTINTLNPATYSSVDTLSFLFDFGMSLKNTNFSENGIRKNARNSSVDYLAMQFRLFRNVGCTLGAFPFSTIGYSFSNEYVVDKNQQDEIIATDTYAGEGGVRAYLIGLGYKPFKFLSVGADFSFLKGNLLHEVDNTFNQTYIYSRQKIYNAQVSSFKMDFGAQTWFTLPNEDKVVFGATFSPKTELHTSDSYIIDNMSSSSTVMSADTTLVSGGFSLPMSVGAGFSYTHHKFSLAVDGKYSRWSEGSFFGESGRDCLRLSAGCTYQPLQSSKNILKRSIYKIGGSWTQSYYNMNSGVAGPDEYCVSAGLSLPIINYYNGLSNVNISAQYAYSKPHQAGLISSQCLRLNIGISFNELWFMRWQVQ